MLTSTKYKKLITALKEYQKIYLNKRINDLDESGTRLMINTLLTDVLDYISIEEVKTEYMIKGTYADYVIQIKGIRHFLIEVKSMSLELSEKHLRQAINYGANEGIEWAVLTNGKQFELYRIIFDKPIDCKKVFSIDLSDKAQMKQNAQYLQYLHKDSVVKKGLDSYWKRCVALDPITVANILRENKVVAYIKKALKDKYKNKFTDDEVLDSIKQVFIESIDIDKLKHKHAKKAKKKNKRNNQSAAEKIVSDMTAK